MQMPYAVSQKNINLNTEKTCLFTSSAGLLWRSPAWLGNVPETPATWAQVAGTRWHEMVSPSDIPRVLHWFAHYSKDVLTFEVMLPIKGVMSITSYVRLNRDPCAVLIIGDFSIISDHTPLVDLSHPMLPAPNCVMLDYENET